MSNPNLILNKSCQTPLQKRILAILRKDGPTSVKELIRHTQMARSTFYGHLEPLIMKEKITKYTVPNRKSGKIVGRSLVIVKLNEQTGE